MLTSTKRLKDLLIKHGITDSFGKKPSVTIKKIYLGRSSFNGKAIYEYDYAVSHVRELTDVEIEALKQDNPYISVFVWRSREKLGRAIEKSQSDYANGVTPSDDCSILMSELADMGMTHAKVLVNGRTLNINLETGDAE